jgi:hypothetical protein
MSILKRQRELKKSEKAARKRAKRHGFSIEEPMEPRPTIVATDFEGVEPAEGEASEEAAPDQETETEQETTH